LQFSPGSGSGETWKSPVSTSKTPEMKKWLRAFPLVALAQRKHALYIILGDPTS